MISLIQLAERGVRFIPDFIERLIPDYWLFVVLGLSLLLAILYSNVKIDKPYSPLKKSGIVIVFTTLIFFVFMFSKL